MKKLMLTTAILAAGTGFATAQDATMPMFRAESDPTEIRASEFIGMRIYASEAAVDANEYAGVQDGWEDIGEVNDVILSRDGAAEAVLVDIGGFLGAGERQVAVDMSAIRFVSDGATGDNVEDFFLVMNAPRSMFEEAPEYGMRGTMADDAMTTATTDAQPVQDGAATTDAATAAATAAAAAAATAAAAGTQPMTDGAMTDGAVTNEQTAAGLSAEEAAQVATDPDYAAVNKGTDAAVAGAQTEAELGQAADGTMGERQPIMRDGYAVAEGDYLTTEKLTGARVYDANDEWIGDVSELVLSEQGQITEAVIDVGGFLGMGEKPVALKLGDVDILRNEGGDDVRVYVSMTKEQLEQLPAFGG